VLRLGTAALALMFASPAMYGGEISMPNNFLEVEDRNFNRISEPGLTKEAREALNGVLKVMSNWRDELVESNEKNGKRLIEKIASAAEELGWPEQFVDATRSQLQTIAETQIKMMDQLTDAWDEQLKLPNPKTASPTTMLSNLKSSGFSPIGGSQSAEQWQRMALSPVQFWMQCAEQWQKSWEQVMTSWVNSRKH
jgi:hypothetical protein